MASDGIKTEEGYGEVFRHIGHVMYHRKERSAKVDKT
jgi:hypothetical protein